MTTAVIFVLPVLLTGRGVENGQPAPEQGGNRPFQMKGTLYALANTLWMLDPARKRTIALSNVSLVNRVPHFIVRPPKTVERGALCLTTQGKRSKCLKRTR